MRYYYDATLITPGVSRLGSLRFDNSSYSSSINLYLNPLDVNNQNLAVYLSQWGLNNSGQVIIKENANSSGTIVIYNVTGTAALNNGSWAIPVRYVTGAKPFADDQLVVEYIANGSTGYTGSAGDVNPIVNTALKIVNTTVSTGTNSGALQVYGGVGIGGDLNVGGQLSAIGTSTLLSAIPAYTGVVRVGTPLATSDTNILTSLGLNSNSYIQMIIQNQSSGTVASTDIIINNDDTSGVQGTFGDFGINSSNYLSLNPGPFDDPSSVYLYSAGTGNLAIGTGGSEGPNPTGSIKFAVNNTTVMTIASANNNPNPSVPGDIIGRGISISRYKTTTQAIVNNITPTADSVLQYTIPGAGVYHIDAEVLPYHSGIAGTTPGLRLGIGYSGVNVIATQSNVLSWGIANGANLANNMIAINGSRTAIALGTTPVTSYIKVSAILYTTGTGVVSLNWAQNVLSTLTTWVGAGSMMRITQVS